jgi:predicted RNA-binding protein with TRAM domain
LFGRRKSLLMTEPLVFGGAVGIAVLFGIGWLLRRRRRSHADTDAQRKRDRAHRAAQKRPPEEAAEKGETYELVVKETQYDRVPPEVRGTINGLQTFVREIPDPNGSNALETGETIRVQVTDYGSKGTTAQAAFRDRR